MEEKKFTLYGHRLSSPCRSIDILCEAEKLPYEYQLVEADKFKSQEFLKINPVGEVPAIVHGDFKLAESGAILTYLCEYYELTKWYPQDPIKRAKVNQWMHWHHTGSAFLITKYILPVVINRGEKKEYEPFLKEKLPKILKSLSNIALEENDFLVGETPTIADLLVFTHIDQCLWSPALEALRSVILQYPRVCRWVESMKDYLNKLDPSRNVYNKNRDNAIPFANKYFEHHDPPTLHYFDIKARGFYVPVLAKFLEFSCDDFYWKKYDFDEWASNKDDVKSKCIFGQLPTLTDGKITVSQSMAIARYLGRKWNLQGKNASQQAICEMIIEESNDLLNLLIRCKYENGNTVESWRSSLEQIPKHFNNLEKMIKTDKFTDDHLMGDFCLFAVINLFVDNAPTCLDEYKGLKAWYAGIYNNHEVKQLLADTKPWFLMPGSMTYTYFGIKGVGWEVPVAAAYLGKSRAEFNWNKINAEEWKKLKPTTPFGNVPILTDGNFTIAQSKAILRYLGKKWDLQGNNMKDFALSEMLIEESLDLKDILTRVGQTPARFQNEELRKLTFKHFSNLEKLMSGARFGSKLSMGDFALWGAINVFLDLDSTLLDNHYTLKSWYDNILINERVNDLVGTTRVFIKFYPIVYHYFDVKGRAFSVPLAAAYLGKTEKEFVWEKYIGDDWKNNKNDIKSKSPFGQLPVITEQQVRGSTTIGQSNAIVRYVAKRWNLVPSDPKEYAISEMLIEESNDIQECFIGIFHAGKTYSSFEEALKHSQQHFTFLEKMLKDGKFTSKRTMGDFCVLQVILFAMNMDPTTLDGHKKLKAWYDQITSNERVKCLVKSSDSPRTVFDRSPLKFHYFPIKARCFNVPMAAAYLGLSDKEFIWNKISFDDWKKDKNEVRSKSISPFNQLPALEDGTKLKLGQSCAITRYLGKLWKIQGKNAKNMAISEMLIEESNEILELIVACKFNFVGASWDELFKTKLPPHWTNIQKLMEGDKFADECLMGYFCLAMVINISMDSDPATLDKHEKLKGWYENLVNHEAVKNLIAKTQIWIKKE